ncbi:hypothetical protein [Sulfolobus sp. S-194]|uniref:hypothetical protein n=1 Tax=Sulfolobus sp. S-194 TaxID=2512240 RepID=UPI00257061CA|nr:hypothetical protein [Sulfolobus sp. S-194]
MPDNIDSIKKFLDLASKYFSRDKRYYFTFFPVTRSGGDNDKNLKVIEPKNRMEIIRELYMYAEQLGLNRPDKNTLLQIDGTPATDDLCDALYPFSIIIRNDGKLFKCPLTVMIGEESVGYIEEDGNIVIDETKIHRWAKYILITLK